MKIIRYTLLADGSSDEALMSIIDWLINQHRPDVSVLGVFARDIGKVGLDLASRVPAALKNFPCDILFIHRDDEGQGIRRRLDEIVAVIGDSRTNYVPVIPVRMTESWLLSDLSAIRSAAGNISGKVDLKLPSKKQWETQANSKAILFDALIAASEKSGRALKKFNPEKERAFVARRTRSFSTLRGLSAFDFFESKLIEKLREI